MKLLLYCTKGKPYLYKLFTRPFDLTDNKINDNIKLNGKVVAECDFEVEKIIPESWNSVIQKWYPEELLKKSGLNVLDLRDYLGSKNNYTGYAIHIKNLHIFDKPKELSEYYTFNSNQHINIDYCKPITKAPQNMIYCWSIWEDHFYKNILISIQPQWLCKILNDEKTIEIRKKVLKKMLYE